MDTTLVELPSIWRHEVMCAGKVDKHSCWYSSQGKKKHPKSYCLPGLARACDMRSSEQAEAASSACASNRTCATDIAEKPNLPKSTHAHGPKLFKFFCVEGGNILEMYMCIYCVYVYIRKCLCIFLVDSGLDCASTWSTDCR